jgi:hypothetical protein
MKKLLEAVRVEACSFCEKDIQIGDLIVRDGWLSEDDGTVCKPCFDEITA